MPASQRPLDDAVVSPRRRRHDHRVHVGVHQHRVEVSEHRDARDTCRERGGPAEVTLAQGDQRQARPLHDVADQVRTPVPVAHDDHAKRRAVVAVSPQAVSVQAVLAVAVLAVSVEAVAVDTVAVETVAVQMNRLQQDREAGAAISLHKEYGVMVAMQEISGR